MKILMRSIKMIAWFEENGKIIPIKYQIADEKRENITIKIDKIILCEEEKLAGNRMYIYRCQSIIDGVEKIYEIKYELGTCRWYLFKI